MNPTFDHYLISSFREKLDHTVLQRLNAFKNVSIQLIRDNSDDRLASYSIAAGDGKQWVYDSSINGATIASSGSLAGQWGDCKVDYQNGRLVGASGITTSPPTIAVAKKHFNSYVTSKSDEELFNQIYFSSGNEQISQTKAVKGDSYYSPCYFIKMGKTDNKGFAMGGEDRTNYILNVSVFVRSEFELLALAGVFRDMRNTSGYILDETPLDEFFDLKSSPWSYSQKMDDMKSEGASKFHIEDVEFTPLTSELLGKKLSNIAIGLARFKVFSVRTPRLV